MLEFAEMDEQFKRLARKLQRRRSDLIGAEVDVDTAVSIFRSLRRGSQSTAKNRGVASTDQDVVNRWRKIEEAKGRRAALPMRDSYADVTFLLPAHLRYTREM